MVETIQHPGYSEMVAPAGHYLTQAAAEPELGRLFCTRRVLLPQETPDAWRVATAEEKDRYEAATQEEGQNSPPHKNSLQMSVDVQITTDGTPLLLTPLPALSELCARFLADPASGGWSVVLLDADGAFASRTPAEAAAFPEGLELRFKAPDGERLALVLTVEDGSVTGAAIEYRGEVKPDEFGAYYDYCEACKAEAKREITQ